MQPIEIARRQRRAAGVLCVLSSLALAMSSALAENVPSDERSIVQSMESDAMFTVHFDLHASGKIARLRFQPV